MKIIVWDVTSCNLLNIYWHFGAMRCLQLQERFQWGLRRYVTPKCRKFPANDWPHIPEKGGLGVWIMDCRVQLFIFISSLLCSRSQWPRGLKRGSAAARLLGSRVRIPPWTWQSVCVVCCKAEVSASSWSRVQSSTGCVCVCVCVCVCECVCVCVCVLDCDQR
jgi:hypothetical protein